MITITLLCDGSAASLPATGQRPAATFGLTETQHTLGAGRPPGHRATGPQGPGQPSPRPARQPLQLVSTEMHFKHEIPKIPEGSQGCHVCVATDA